MRNCIKDPSTRGHSLRGRTWSLGLWMWTWIWIFRQGTSSIRLWITKTRFSRCHRTLKLFQISRSKWFCHRTQESLLRSQSIDPSIPQNFSIQMGPTTHKTAPRPQVPPTAKSIIIWSQYFQPTQSAFSRLCSLPTIQRIWSRSPIKTVMNKL